MHTDTPPSAHNLVDPRSTALLGEGSATGDRRRALGRLGEALAAEHLERLGFSTVARSVRTRLGEIDLIAFDGRTVVFCEVNARRVSGAQRRVRPDQQPLGPLRPRQRARLRRLAATWLRESRNAGPRLRRSASMGWA